MAKLRQPEPPPDAAPPDVVEGTTAFDQAQDDPSDLFGEGSFLLFDDEVGGVVNQAMRDEWGVDRVKEALTQTNAYKEISERRAALADPVGGDQTRQELGWKVAAMLGRNPNDPMAKDMTRRLEAGAATWSSLQALSDPGELGTPTSRVQELAAMHGLPMGPDTAASYTGMPEGQVDQELAMLSQQLYPYKPAGAPWQRFAGIFADIHRAELGKEVPTNDPLLEAKIAEAQGNPAIFRQLLRQSPAWEDSDVGRAMFQERSNQLLHDLQFGQAAEEQMDLQAGQYDLQSQVAASSGMQNLGTSSGADSPGVGGELNIPASGSAGALIRAASQWIGYDYVWGGESVEEGGFDCSGLVWAAARTMGINLPRTARQQQAATPYIGRLNVAKPGDLLFWDDGGGAHHVAIYLGGGRMLAAPHRGAKVRIQAVYGDPEVHRLLG